jgi:sec-independent protein translocase protein TatB
MLDIGWTELLVIGVVALIVVGPKDLPKMFHTLGQFTAKIRRMAREFSRAMEDAAEASGARDVARDLRKATSPRSMGADALKKATKFDLDDPFGEDEADDPVAGKSDDTSSRGPHTEKMTEERREAARKIREYSADKAREREAQKTAEAGAASAAAGEIGDSAAVTGDSGPDDRTDGKA